MIRLLHSHPFLQMNPGHPLHPTGTWGRRQVPPGMCGHRVDILQPECSPAQRQRWQIKELPGSYPWGSASLGDAERMVLGLGITVGPGEGSSQLKRHPDSRHKSPWDNSRASCPAAQQEV